MTDIVERLRKQMMLSDLQSGLQPHYVCHEAADEIERLREALHEIMAVPNSEAAPGIMKVIAKQALGEDK